MTHPSMYGFLPSFPSPSTLPSHKLLVRLVILAPADTTLYGLGERVGPLKLSMNDTCPSSCCTLSALALPFSPFVSSSVPLPASSFLSPSLLFPLPPFLFFLRGTETPR